MTARPFGLSRASRQGSTPPYNYQPTKTHFSADKTFIYDSDIGMIGDNMKAELRIYSKNFAGCENNKYWLCYEENSMTKFCAFCDEYSIHDGFMTMYTETSFCELVINKDTEIHENLDMGTKP